MQEIARLAKADVGLEIAFAESNQWDHHVNEGGATGQIANRLADFADGIAALARDLGDRMADTIILTMSEFGRTVAENGNRGTDHGHGNAMMLIGGDVQRRRVSRSWPGLAAGRSAHEGRDLKVTTDFRDVFGEVVMRHLGADEATAARVFPGYGVKPAQFRGVRREPARLKSDPSRRLGTVSAHELRRCMTLAGSLHTRGPHRTIARSRQHRAHAGRRPGRGIRLRPHAKTHKSPLIARWQIDRGAVGICCAKLGEAEVFADAGVADIRLPYPLNPSTPTACSRLPPALAFRSSSTTRASPPAGLGRSRPPASRSTCS